MFFDKIKYFSTLIFLMGISSFGWAQSSVTSTTLPSLTSPGANGISAQDEQENSEEEKQLRAKAKSRMYPGGKDEEPLKVQSQLATPNRKMTPTVETTMEEPPAADEAHD